MNSRIVVIIIIVTVLAICYPIMVVLSAIALEPYVPDSEIAFCAGTIIWAFTAWRAWCVWKYPRVKYDEEVT